MPSPLIGATVYRQRVEGLVPKVWLISTIAIPQVKNKKGYSECDFEQHF